MGISNDIVGSDHSNLNIEEDQFILYRIEEHNVLISIDLVQEITPLSNITFISQTNRYIYGMTNLKGTATVVLKLRKDNVDDINNAFLLVLNLEGLKVSILLTSLPVTIKFPKESLVNTPGFLSSKSIFQKYINGFYKSGSDIFLLFNVLDFVNNELRSIQ